MKAAPITKKPSFPLMKQGDIQNIYHLQMPRWLFTDPRYIGLSLEAKVTYTFLLNRFQLSRLNGWLNDDGEVFIIYTRRSLSSEMQVSRSAGAARHCGRFRSPRPELLEVSIRNFKRFGNGTSRS